MSARLDVSFIYSGEINLHMNWGGNESTKETRQKVVRRPTLMFERWYQYMKVLINLKHHLQQV